MEMITNKTGNLSDRNGKSNTFCCFRSFEQIVLVFKRKYNIKTTFETDLIPLFQVNKHLTTHKPRNC